MQSKVNKPLIGINPYYFYYNDDWWMATKQDYLTAVWSSGGLPMTVHHQPKGETVEEIVHRIDGLVMVGGPDFPSNMYAGRNPELLSEIIHPAREVFDRAMFWEARQQGKPILAICAGMQHINIIYGGSLYEDLPSQKENLNNHGEFGGDFGTHIVDLDINSCLYDIMGEKTPTVRCTHHQGIRQLGENLNAVAWSEDGLIEAIEDKDEPRAFIAIQWHPELYQEDRANRQIFERLIEEAVGRSTMNG